MLQDIEFTEIEIILHKAYHLYLLQLLYQQIELLDSGDIGALVRRYHPN